MPLTPLTSPTCRCTPRKLRNILPWELFHNTSGSSPWTNGTHTGAWERLDVGPVRPQYQVRPPPIEPGKNFTRYNDTDLQYRCFEVLTGMVTEIGIDVSECRWRGPMSSTLTLR